MDALRALQEQLQLEGHPPLDNVTFYRGEASAVIKEKDLKFSHVYSFDYSINNSDYMDKLADVIENMPFKIFCSSKTAAYWDRFELYVKEITFDEGVKNDIDFHISRSKERHRMYFYKKKRGEDPSPFHKTLPELLKAVDRSIATFTPQDVVRFFHQVTMRHLRYTAASFKVSVSYKD